MTALLVALVAGALHFAGALMIRLVAPRTPIGFALTTGLLWGMLAYAGLALLLLSAGIPYTRTTISCAALPALAALGAWMAIRRDRPPVSLLHAAMASVAVVALAGLAFLTPYRFMTMDSSALLLIGRSLAIHGGFDLSLAGAASIDFGWLSNHGALVPILQSTALFFGRDYHPELAPLTAACLLAAFVWYFAPGAAEGALRRRTLACTALALLLSSYFVALHAFYVHNNLIAAAYLFVAVLSVWRSQVEREPQWLSVAALALLGFSLARLDSIVMGVLLVLYVASRSEFTPAIRTRFAALYCLPMLLWHLQLWRITTDAAAVMPPVRALLIVAGLAAVLLVVSFSRFAPLERFWRHAPNLALAALFTALALASARYPAEMANSMDGFFRNLLSQGGWAALWPGLAALAALAALTPPLPAQGVFAYILAAYLPLLQLLALARHAPYRLGWSDSGNRMFLAATPILLFWLLARLAQPAAARPAAAPPTARCRPILLGALAATCLAALTLSATPPRDLAVAAAVLESPVCAPGYGMEVAVAPRLQFGAFVSAAEPCPTTATIDLRRLQPVEMITLAMHDAERRFLDYSLCVSTDAQRWHIAYDTRNPTPYTAIHGPAHAAIDLRGITPETRFLRLTLRAAAQENRLLLNRLGAWTRWSHTGSAASPTSDPQTEIEPWTPFDALAHTAASGAALVDERGEFDAAIGATLLEGPAAAHGHDFSIALRGVLDDRHAVALRPAPATFTLDLGWVSPLCAVELIAPAPEAAWTDFSISVATESDWRPIFDSRHDALRLTRQGPVARAEWAAPVVARQMRVEFRAAADGGGPRISRFAAKARLRPALLPPQSDVARRLGRQLDLAIGAEVLAAPQCAPGFGPGLLLRGVSDARFMSAVQPCPTELRLDLGAEVEADILLIEEHDPTRGLRDFACDVSADGVAWRGVFDTAQNAPPHRPDPGRMIISLRDASPLRYVRLRARSAEGENRLLLSRLAIFRE